MSSERVPSSLQHTKELPSSSSSSYSDGPRPKRERPRKERVFLHFHLSRMQIGIRALRRSFPRTRRRRLSGLSFYSLLSSSSCFYNTYHRRRRRPYTLSVPTVVCAMKVERGGFYSRFPPTSPSNPPPTTVCRSLSALEANEMEYTPFQERARARREIPPSPN